MEFFEKYWQTLLLIGGIISAIVLFGKNLADLILKWKEVLSNWKKGKKNFTLRNGDIFSESFKIEKEPFTALAQSECEGNILKFIIKQENNQLTFKEVLELWQTNLEFVDFYVSLFRDCSFKSFVWETPPITIQTVDRHFEFVFHRTPKTSENPDRKTYKDYYDLRNSNYGIVAFPNLGHDATLVVPSPLKKNSNYSGLVEFFREAPKNQKRALWQVTAYQIRLRLTNEPVWLSVAGGGIAWLHIRIDTSPKYYRYKPYIRFN